MRYSEAVEFLFQLQKFGAILGLDKTIKLAELAGRPQDRLRFIHVAGTNGKGSTCAMLESIYRHAGYRTGLFTSPHLISFAERIQINRQLIPEHEVARLVSEMRDLLQRFPEGEHVTFFEVVTVMALRWFAEQKCDIVIWETGLGGRLDATNIVTPLASVITNIQRDHEKWLGHTLPEIAREKAGIIKPGVPVFTAAEDPAAWTVIKQTAGRLHSPLFRVEADDALTTSLPGPHQKTNAAVAVAVARHLRIPIEQAALTTVHWPGRFDVRGRYILDGAHNPDGARTLRLTLEQSFPGVKPAFIVGILADKDIPAIARELTRVASNIFTVSVQSDRGADAEILATEFRKIAPDVPVAACASLAEAIDKTRSADRVVITGSLHFIGEAMEFLHFEAGAPNERPLNDWHAAQKTI